MDKSILENFTDDELLVLVHNIDVNELLQPIKQNNRRYAKYISRLGRLDRKSVLVQKNLPGISIELYQKHDQAFVKRIEANAKKLRDILLRNFQNVLEHKVSTEELQALTIQQYVDILKKIEDSTKTNLKFDLLWVQLKLAGVVLDAGKKADIINMWLQNRSFIMDTTEDSVQTGEGAENDQVISISENEKNSAEESTVQLNSVKSVKTGESADKGKISQEEFGDVSGLGTKEELVKEKREIGGSIDRDSVWSEDIDGETVSKNNGEEKVRVYVGRINIRANFYNFTPIGEIVDGSFIAFQESDIAKLLPDSQFQNINLYYNVYDDGHKNLMENFFYDGQIVLFEFSVGELLENVDGSGRRNPTGYKISGVESIRSGKIRNLWEDGFYALKSESILLDDIRSHKIVKIQDDDIVEGEKILINLRDGFYAGPYEVKYSNNNFHFYIMPQLQENKFTLSGYSANDCIRAEINSSMGARVSRASWYYYKIKPDVLPTVKDVISDEKLLESFRDNLDKNGTREIRVENVGDILEKYRKSLLVGNVITEDIRNQRIERIKGLLTSEEKIEAAYSQISDLICDLLIKNEDIDKMGTLFSAILEKRPDFEDKIQGIRIVKERIENSKQELELLETQKAEIKEEIENIQYEAKNEALKREEEDLDEKIVGKREEIQKLSEKLELIGGIEELNNKMETLRSEVSYLENHHSRLQRETPNYEKNFIDLVNRYSEKIVDITFDGFMSSKMLQTAAEWEASETGKNDKKLICKINDIPTEAFTAEELVGYLTDLIQSVRPGYDRNMIVNLFVCTMQGFLTVLSGKPGCGKTSICNIMAKVLGLTRINKVIGEGQKERKVNRYVMVSVERGWTSKRDLVGYYNPLTKAFEESNREVFDALRLLNVEAQEGIKKFPYIILLDEANLSPMEYYWADFMNVCDDLQDNYTINLGNNNIFEIPETLHFLATINSDHTTEILSPRLIDRAWIVTLPKIGKVQNGFGIPEEKIKCISWESLSSVFVVSPTENSNFDNEVQKIYDGMHELLNQKGLQISPRVDIAVHKYWTKASRLMEEDEYGNSPGIIALDYAIIQKILPKIGGNGEEYEEWLEKLRSYCTENSLMKSAESIQIIIEHGNRQMKYYQFFN